MYFTDDPLYDFTRYDTENQKWLDSRPICAGCGDPIQENVCYEINGHKYCQSCGDQEHLVWHIIRNNYLCPTIE